MKVSNTEEFVYQAVLNGELEIMPDGTIWRTKMRQWSRWKQKLVLIPIARRRAEHATSKGYFLVHLMIDGKRRGTGAHRLVFRHFNGKLPLDLEVNHKDGNKKNNRPDNLELVTRSEQQIHAVRVLKVGWAANQNGPEHRRAKLSTEQVEEIRRRRTGGETHSAIALDLGVSKQTVCKIALWKSRVIC